METAGECAWEGGLAKAGPSGSGVGDGQSQGSRRCLSPVCRSSPRGQPFIDLGPPPQTPPSSSRMELCGDKGSSSVAFSPAFGIMSSAQKKLNKY